MFLMWVGRTRSLAMKERELKVKINLLRQLKLVYQEQCLIFLISIIECMFPIWVG